jgi:hypothetical protein
MHSIWLNHAPDTFNQQHFDLKRHFSKVVTGRFIHLFLAMETSSIIVALQNEVTI